MKPRAARVGALILTLALTPACRKAPEATPPPQADGDPVVARYAGGEIRRSEISAAVERRLAAVPKPVAVETRRLMVRKAVERRVRIVLLEAEARAEGFAERPEVQQLATAGEERLLAADLVAREMASVHAADGLVAAALERRLQSVHPEEARRFSHIFLRAPEGDEAARFAAEAHMQEILSELKAGAGFSDLAKRHSDSVTARGGGRIEWTLRKDLQRAAADAVFALREGALSPVVATRDGLHLFRIDGIRSASPIDVEAVRSAVRKELDAETRAVAERALRQQALDAAGVELASPARIARATPAGGEWVARWKGGEVTAQELRALAPTAPGQPDQAVAALRELVENRLLAAQRRSQGLDPELEARLRNARKEALLETYRTSLVAKLDSIPSEEEIARYYRDNAQGALFLRDYRLDVLFFPQTGKSVADVYAAGEAVVAELRAGSAFEPLLDRPLRPDAQVCRDAHGIDLEALGKFSLRLRKALLNLAAGEVSPAIYLDGPRSPVARGQCVLEGPGVAFVHLREIRTLPLESAREAIRAGLAKEKERAGIDAIQARLVAGSGLEILLPEG